jgi:hypothetical protein
MEIMDGIEQLAREQSPPKRKQNQKNRVLTGFDRQLLQSSSISTFNLQEGVPE